ncbi:MAG: hypothetical protein LBL66_06575 [Clostridiales bacterium]|nr:hypothetical protein [Clostridiales bacterium]
MVYAQEKSVQIQAYNIAARGDKGEVQDATRHWMQNNTKTCAKVKQEGCRDAIIVWDGVIVDGNRYKICTEFGIPFRTLEKT